MWCWFPFSLCSACGPILISFSACESELRDSIKTVPHRAQCWSCPQEWAGSHAADRPDYGQWKRRSNGEFHARYGTCITERPGLVERPAPLGGPLLLSKNNMIGYISFIKAGSEMVSCQCRLHSTAICFCLDDCHWWKPPFLSWIWFMAKWLMIWFHLDAVSRRCLIVSVFSGH